MSSGSWSSFLTGCSVMALYCLNLPCVAAQESSAEALKSGSAHQLSEQEQLRRNSNAEYVGFPIRTRITQRFEMYSPHSEEALRELKSMGFTQVILDWPNLHPAATNAGLKVVLANWWTQDTKPEDIETGIQRAREADANSLIGFSVMDEPGRNAPDTPFGFYIDLYEQLKPVFRQEFPATRLEISHWGPMASWDERYYEYFSFLYEAADVMRIMPYPDLHEAPLDDVFFMMQRSRKLMKIAQRELPLVVILQTWILPPKNELPEIDELRVMALQAMLSGAETVSFFDFNTEVWNETPGYQEHFRGLMAELTNLSRRYREHTLETELSEDGILKSTLTSPVGIMTRIEINTRRYAVGAFKPLEVRESTLQTGDVCPPSVAIVRQMCLPMTIESACCCCADGNAVPCPAGIVRLRFCEGKGARSAKQFRRSRARSKNFRNRRCW